MYILDYFILFGILRLCVKFRWGFVAECYYAVLTLNIARNPMNYVTGGNILYSGCDIIGIILIT